MGKTWRGENRPDHKERRRHKEHRNKRQQSRHVHIPKSNDKEK